MVCYQEEVRDPSRIAEVLNRVIEKAWRGSAPAQINVPRDYWTQVIDIEPAAGACDLERPRGGEQAIAEAAKLLSEAKFPVILNGAGVVLAVPSRRPPRWPSASTRRCAATTSTTTPSPVRIRSPSARSATTARRRRWS